MALCLACVTFGAQAQLVDAGVSGSAVQKSSAIKEALADSIRLRAEANKEKILAKHGQQAAEANVQAAKTKNFAYTKIHIPGA